MKNSDALEELMEKKLSKLDRYFKSEAEAKVTMSTIKRTNFKVEVLIPFNGLILRAEETSDDMHKSVDKVVDKLERQLRNDFYIFEDIDGITSVIYRRKDGNYGLIERAGI